jgi:hypothetical protein
MEINITKYFKYPPKKPICGSQLQYGPDAGRWTYQNAKNYAKNHNLLDTPQKVEAFNRHVADFGAWEDKEIASWSHKERVALFVQLIESDVLGHGPVDDRPEDNEGYCFRGDDGEIYYLAD